MQTEKKITEIAGDEHDNQTSSTFVIEGEGHTLGNILKNIISNYADVQFCGYTLPHPVENKIHFRIQSTGKTKAIEILKRGLEDIKFICDTVLETPM
ncbi:hypothetical protein PVAND_014678 [Polypedilum vanderplanki]|uniref:DNA-directed RNA polymerase I subunit D n=1 Tax=Polypedilum vanderplanki TaxID=319348 RepID=A0A9J6BAE9_POLVA|nr:hypothetical protein PVAND_014678 [Polypedilum vanderplanki]